MHHLQGFGGNVRCGCDVQRSSDRRLLHVLGQRPYHRGRYDHRLRRREVHAGQPLPEAALAGIQENPVERVPVLVPFAEIIHCFPTSITMAGFMEIAFPYPDVPHLSIPEQNLLGVFAAPECPWCAEPAEIVRNALEAPIGSPRLAERALACRPGGARSVLIVVDDVSRPPEHLILPPGLEELRAAGVPDSCIELLVALDSHRHMSRAEIAARYPVQNHD